jgi:hypothetical protein
MEDAELTLGQVEILFGKAVRGIVQGETRYPSYPS